MQLMASNIEFSCFYLFVNYNGLDNSLKREFDDLLSEIEATILSGKEIETRIPLSFNKVFRIRILALKAILRDEESILDLFDESYPYFEDLANDEKMNLLGENILFAIRSNIRVAKAIFSSPSFSQQDLENGMNEFQDKIFELEQFISLFSLSTPPAGITHSILDWLKASLTLEYIILSAAIIKDRKLVVTTATIKYLARAIADATHNYNAIAFEMGILKSSTGYHPERVVDSPDQEFIIEQKKIADSDLSSFSKNWSE